MEKSPPPQFRLLSDEEFTRLPLADRLAYLQEAIKVRNLIDRQLEASLAESLKTLPSGK